MTTSTAPVSDVTLAELGADPYSCYERFRDLGRVVWVPVLGRYAITHYDDIVAVERQPELFTAADLDSPMVRSLGEAIVAKDGPAHRRERRACEPALRPKRIQAEWRPQFQRNVDDIIDSFVDRGRGDLVADLGAPLASRNLAYMLGFPHISDETMLGWSKAIIAGCGNYAQAPDVWERNDAARREIDEAVAEAHPRLRAEPDASIVSSMINCDDPLSPEEIGRNVAVIVGGGISEPNHALSIAVLCLVNAPELLADVQRDETLWKQTFEEALRWVSPIAAYPRKLTADAEIAGTPLREGDSIIAVAAAANRDGGRVENADRFDLHREPTAHLAFGSGPHMCMGSWMARVSIGQVALPTVFRRLPDLELDEPGEIEWSGWMFRGPVRLPVRWRA